MSIPLTERTDRLTRWFRRENDRPLLGFYLGAGVPSASLSGKPDASSERVGLPGGCVVADYLDDSDRLYELYEDAGGDLIWSAAPFWECHGWKRRSAAA